MQIPICLQKILWFADEFLVIWYMSRESLCTLCLCTLSSKNSVICIWILGYLVHEQRCFWSWFGGWRSDLDLSKTMLDICGDPQDWWTSWTRIVLLTVGGHVSFDWLLDLSVFTHVADTGKTSGPSISIKHNESVRYSNGPIRIYVIGGGCAAEVVLSILLVVFDTSAIFLVRFVIKLGVCFG